jgi:hypothetical protein
MEYLKTLKDNFVPKLKISQTDITFANISYGDS